MIALARVIEGRDKQRFYDANGAVIADFSAPQPTAQGTLPAYRYSDSDMVRILNNAAEIIEGGPGAAAALAEHPARAANTRWTQGPNGPIARFDLADVDFLPHQRREFERQKEQVAWLGRIISTGLTPDLKDEYGAILPASAKTISDDEKNSMLGKAAWILADPQGMPHEREPRTADDQLMPLAQFESVENRPIDPNLPPDERRRLREELKQKAEDLKYKELDPNQREVLKKQILGLQDLFIIDSDFRVFDHYGRQLDREQLEELIGPGGDRFWLEKPPLKQMNVRLKRAGKDPVDFDHYYSDEELAVLYQELQKPKNQNLRLDKDQAIDTAIKQRALQAATARQSNAAAQQQSHAHIAQAAQGAQAAAAAAAQAAQAAAQAAQAVANANNNQGNNPGGGQTNP